MKNRIHKIAIVLTLGLLLGMSAVIYAQPSAPPPPSNHGGASNAAPGGFSPIGSGLAILLGLGAAYGAKKVFDSRKKSEE